MLRREPPAEGQKAVSAGVPNEAVLNLWEAWLKFQTPPAEADTVKADETKPAPTQK